MCNLECACEGDVLNRDQCEKRTQRILLDGQFGDHAVGVALDHRVREPTHGCDDARDVTFDEESPHIGG
jgi:hypothetical protein